MGCAQGKYEYKSKFASMSKEMKQSSTPSESGNSDTKTALSSKEQSPCSFKKQCIVIKEIDEQDFIENKINNEDQIIEIGEKVKLEQSKEEEQKSVQSLKYNPRIHRIIIDFKRHGDIDIWKKQTSTIQNIKQNQDKNKIVETSPKPKQRARSVYKMNYQIQGKGDQEPILEEVSKKRRQKVKHIPVSQKNLQFNLNQQILKEQICSYSSNDFSAKIEVF